MELENLKEYICTNIFGLTLIQLQTLALMYGFYKASEIKDLEQTVLAASLMEKIEECLSVNDLPKFGYVGYTITTFLAENKTKEIIDLENH